MRRRLVLKLSSKIFALSVFGMHKLSGCTDSSFYIQRIVDKPKTMTFEELDFLYDNAFGGKRHPLNEFIKSCIQNGVLKAIDVKRSDNREVITYHFRSRKDFLRWKKYVTNKFIDRELLFSFKIFPKWRVIS